MEITGAVLETPMGQHLPGPAHRLGALSPVRRFKPDLVDWRSVTKMSEAIPEDGDFRTVVRQLKDRVDILETMYAYCRHADRLDGDSMSSLFVEDCISQFIPGGPETVLRGRRALNDFLNMALG